MNKSESIKNLAAAMAAFQGKVKNPPRSADNPFYKSKYAPLEVVVDTAKPILNECGLSYIQSCSGDGSNISVTTLIMHSSGEWVETEPLIVKAERATAQGAGSAITYARRYALAAALGLASDDDDDGNGAEPNGTKGSQKPKAAHKCSDCHKDILPAKGRTAEQIIDGSIKTYGVELCAECSIKRSKQ